MDFYSARFQDVVRKLFIYNRITLISPSWHIRCNRLAQDMNVGLYSGAAGMRVGQDYQSLVSENLAMQSVPGYKQTMPVFTTDTTVSSQGSLTPSGNPAAVHMTRMVDFSQGPIQPSSSPYHMAIEGKGFFAVRESDGSTSYTRNGAFDMSPRPAS